MVSTGVPCPPLAVLPLANVTAPTSPPSCIGIAVGACTVTTAVPDTPPLVAVMVSMEASNVDTTPVADTATALVSLADHAIVGLLMVLPCASFTVALSATLSPATSVIVGGVTVMDAAWGPPPVGLLLLLPQATTPNAAHVATTPRATSPTFVYMSPAPGCGYSRHISFHHRCDRPETYRTARAGAV